MVVAGGCLAPAADRSPPRGDEPALTIWVLDHGWHTAVVVRRSDVDRARWPELDDFSDATLVEVAWGDREFYLAKSPTPWLAMRAAFVTSGSVLHVVGFTAPAADSFAGSAAVAIRLSRRSFDALADFVHAEYQRDHNGGVLRQEAIISELGGDSFYRFDDRHFIY